MTNHPITSILSLFAWALVLAGCSNGASDESNDIGQDMTSSGASDMSSMEDDGPEIEAISCPAGSYASDEGVCVEDACVEVFGVPCVALEDAFLTNSPPTNEEGFGSSVAVSGDTLAIGHYSPLGTPSVHVFTRHPQGGWSRQAILRYPGLASGDHRFGWSIALDGDTLAVGANWEPLDDDREYGSGGVYVFERSQETWELQAHLRASNAERHDEFGFAVALSGDRLAVGAPGESSNATGVGGDQEGNSQVGSGAVYVFERAGTTWNQRAYIKASDTSTEATFGRVVSLSGDLLAVSAPAERVQRSGAVYIFEHTTGGWVEQARLKASEPASNDHYGQALAIVGDTLVISAPLQKHVDVFERVGGQWQRAERLDEPGSGERESVRYKIALSGDTLVIGTPYADAGDGLHIFTRTDGAWSPFAYLQDPNENDRKSRAFGLALALDGDALVVGDPRQHVEGHWEAGTATVFRLPPRP